MKYTIAIRKCRERALFHTCPLCGQFVLPTEERSTHTCETTEDEIDLIMMDEDTVLGSLDVGPTATLLKSRWQDTLGPALLGSAFDPKSEIKDVTFQVTTRVGEPPVLWLAIRYPGGVTIPHSCTVQKALALCITVSKPTETSGIIEKIGNCARTVRSTLSKARSTLQEKEKDNEEPS